jgi:saccharopine dehydrogenase (NADP+, L-glutamate forming)
MEGVQNMTHCEFLDSFLPAIPDCDSVAEKLCTHFGLKPAGPEMIMLKWSGFFDATPIGLKKGTPAAILEFILNKKWSLNKGDLDQIVMWHRFRYQLDGADKEIQASLVATGVDDVYTAMARTVGLPLGIATRLIATGKISARGVIIPTTPEFYNPILQELSGFGIALNEMHIH